MNTDFLIIGGGIAGISAAARLSAFGSVTVLEAEAALAYHSTGRSAALFVENYGNAPVVALNRASKEYLSRENGGVLSPRGLLVVATPEEEELFVDAVLVAGHDEISLDEALARVPVLRRDKIIRAAFDNAAQDIDVDLLLQNFVRELRGNGGAIVLNKCVESITRSDGLWNVRASDEDYAAPVLVNAAGAWADQMARLAGVTALGIQPYRRSVARVPAPPGHDISNWPAFASAIENWYAKPDAGCLLVSPADEDPVNAMDAWADDMVLAEGIDRYSQLTTHEITRVESNWAGLRSFAPDRTPVVGFDPGADGFFWLAGQGGYGVQTSPAMSLLAQQLITGQPVTLDAEVATLLDPARLG
jgi:D-arginine dehydrogenase